MEKNFDARALLSGQFSFLESEFEAKREKLLRGTLKEAKQYFDKKEWAKYWAALYQSATQIGFDDSDQEEAVVESLDTQFRGEV